MNAMSNYSGNQNALTGNLEKLSSGYRINSAADDAAGLAISEKMRSQIAGLEKAQDNANDGISLVQTAEGALTEVNSMLTRLTTLATQSANGTYEDGVDRANLQEETDALLSEIDRISQSTNFNGINLLDGSLSGAGGAGGTLKGAQIATFKGATQTTTAAVNASGNNAPSFDDETIYVDSAQVTVKWGNLSSDDQEALKADWTQNKSIDKGNAAAAIMQDSINQALKEAGFTNSVTVTAKTAASGGTIFTLQSNEESGNSNLSKSGGSGTVLSTLTGLSTNKAEAVSNISNASDMQGVFNMNINGTDYKIDMSAGIRGYGNVVSVGTSNLASVQAGTAQLDAGDFASSTDGATGFANDDELYAALTAIYDSVNNNSGNNPTDDDTSMDGVTWINFDSTGQGSPTGPGNDMSIKYGSVDWSGNSNINEGDNAGKYLVSYQETYKSTTSGSDIADDLKMRIDETIDAYNKSASNDQQINKDDITVEFTSDGRLQINNNTNASISFSDIGSTDTFAKSLGIASGSSNVKGNGLTLQVGDTNADYQKVTVSIDDMSSKGLGLTGLDISNQDAAGDAIDTIKAAVNKVSTQRGKLGALQNRLDHTLNNLDATTQNIQAAESQIRDVDMAKEMTQYSKNNILVQAAQSMLAQANSMPQGVLSLLQ
jgi:flagellin